MTSGETKAFLKLQEILPCDSAEHTIEALHVFELALANALVTLSVNTGRDEFECACDNIREGMDQIIAKKIAN
jgi:hypothetical protein